MEQTKQCARKGCNRPVHARGWCKTHYERWRRHGDVGLTGRWRPEQHGSYHAMHSRLKRVRPLAGRTCIDCGRPAQEWSYKGGDPAERMSPQGRAYSRDANFYVPRCRSCHRKHDIRKARSRRKETR